MKYSHLILLIAICFVSPKTHSQWKQKGLDIDGESIHDNSGSTVSISSDGNIIAIGAPRNDGAGENSGHVRVYHWIGSSWKQKGVDIDGEAIHDNSGSTVSISSDGNTLAIGADRNDGSGYDCGHVRVYHWIGSSWKQKGVDIDGDGAHGGDHSGCSVSISSDGNMLAIGALKNSNKNGFHSGHVRLYHWRDESWVQKGLDIDGEAILDHSGNSVSISSDGNTLAIGAWSNDGPSGYQSLIVNSDFKIYTGHVRVYHWTGESWVQKGLDIDGESANDYSGYSVSISSDGNTLAIGALANDGAGYVRVYHWIDSIWKQKGLDIDGEAIFDQSGNSVSISSDGNTLAIGADGNDGAGENSGYVRIYKWNGNKWCQLGQDIEGEAMRDYSGRSVSISSDGNSLAIGAPLNDGAGENSGHVRVYYIDADAQSEYDSIIHVDESEFKEKKEVIDKAFNNLEFETGKAVIKESSYSSLSQVVNLMNMNSSYKLKLVGHTDNVGDPMSNLTLSEKRVDAVRNYLVQFGIDENRVIVNFEGQNKPIATNDTEEGRQKNRRVEMTIIK